MPSRLRLAPVLCCALSACNQPAQKEQAKVYPFHGTVVSLDPNTNVASIHNDKIPGCHP